MHLVHFQVVGRYPLIYDSNSDQDHFCGSLGGGPGGHLNGVCLGTKVSVQHDGPGGVGRKAYFPKNPLAAYDVNGKVLSGPEYSSEVGGRKDVVTALPGQVTKIRAKFTKRGRYVWHCHILSHEDHEMMRLFTVA